MGEASMNHLSVVVSDTDSAILSYFASIGFPQTFTHIDLLLVDCPADAQSISIDTIREQIPDLFRGPVKASRRIFLIRQADRLSIPAAQALLKTIEEPPAQVQCILATNYPSLLLPTIRSRCLDLTHKGEPVEAPVAMIDLDAVQTAGDVVMMVETLGTDRVACMATLRVLLDNTAATKHQRISALLEALRLLANNVSIKLVLDTLFQKIAQDNRVYNDRIGNDYPRGVKKS